MKLVIAEKPSVAQSLATVIGATVRKDGYLEGNGWRVSWCVGHLAGLADADVYNPDYAKWRYDDLPILPEHWQMVVSKDKKKQFAVLKQLMNAPDVTEVVNACIAGVDHLCHILPAHQLPQNVKLLLLFRADDEAERGGNDGQRRQRPFGIIGIVNGGVGQLCQMPETPRHDVPAALQIPVMP